MNEIEIGPGAARGQVTARVYQAAEAAHMDSTVTLLTLRGEPVARITSVPDPDEGHMCAGCHRQAAEAALAHQASAYGPEDQEYLALAVTSIAHSMAAQNADETETDEYHYDPEDERYESEAGMQAQAVARVITAAQALYQVNPRDPIAWTYTELIASMFPGTDDTRGQLKAIHALITAPPENMGNIPAWFAYAGVPLEEIPEHQREEVAAHRRSLDTTEGH